LAASGSPDRIGAQIERRGPVERRHLAPERVAERRKEIGLEPFRVVQRTSRHRGMIGRLLGEPARRLARERQRAGRKAVAVAGRAISSGRTLDEDEGREKPAPRIDRDAPRPRRSSHQSSAARLRRTA